MSNDAPGAATSDPTTDFEGAHASEPFQRLKRTHRSFVFPLGAALLRGSYHLYQGFGAFIGNFAMGIAFGWLYTRFGRLLPLVIAHFLLDAAIFVGYPWAAATFPELFGSR